MTLPLAILLGPVGVGGDQVHHVVVQAATLGFCLLDNGLVLVSVFEPEVDGGSVAHGGEYSPKSVRCQMLKNGRNVGWCQSGTIFVQPTNNDMSHTNQFDRVLSLCNFLKAERGEGGEHTTNEAVSVATAYLLACDRTKRHHHFEDSPAGCFDASVDTEKQQAAFDAVWDIIGDLGDNPRYAAAWDVWGVLLPSADDDEGMGQE